MKEGSGPLTPLLRGVYHRAERWLSSGVDVEVEPLTLGFSVCFRHDMDNLEEGHLDRFLELEAPLGCKSTLFFLESQVRGFASRIRNLDSRFECTLHSEAKPSPSKLVALPALGSGGESVRPEIEASDEVLSVPHRRCPRARGARGKQLSALSGLDQLEHASKTRVCVRGCPMSPTGACLPESRKERSSLVHPDEGRAPSAGSHYQLG